MKATAHMHTCLLGRTHAMFISRTDAKIRFSSPFLNQGTQSGIPTKHSLNSRDLRLQKKEKRYTYSLVLLSFLHTISDETVYLVITPSTWEQKLRFVKLQTMTKLGRNIYQSPSQNVSEENGSTMAYFYCGEILVAWLIQNGDPLVFGLRRIR